jgi:5'-deoxynucleotidase YfbR-like HD superfamily hydrolase/predicted transcriptional regulator
MLKSFVVQLDAELLKNFQHQVKRTRRSQTGAFREAFDAFVDLALKVKNDLAWQTDIGASKALSKAHFTLDQVRFDKLRKLSQSQHTTHSQIANEAVHRWYSRQPLNPVELPAIPDSLREGGTAWLNTWSGKKVYPYDLKPAMVDIDDIARGLAHINRFAGQLSYTVAQHSVAVAMALEVLIPQNPVVWLQGLLHDASEAYLGDLPAPLKRTGAFPLYDLAEAQAQAAIFEALGIDEPNEAQSALIKQADLACLALEQRELWPQNRRHADWLEKDGATEGYVFRTLKPELGFLGAFSRYSRILDEGGAG